MQANNTSCLGARNNQIDLKTLLKFSFLVLNIKIQ